MEGLHLCVNKGFSNKEMTIVTLSVYIRHLSATKRNITFLVLLKL